MRRAAGAIIITVFLSIFAIPGVLCASTIEISWNRNSESDVVGYRVYYGTASGTYTNVLNVGNVNTVDLTRFAESSTYYFAVTAYNCYLESVYSNEVSVTTPTPVISLLTRIVSWLTGLFTLESGNASPVSQYSIEDFSQINTASVSKSYIILHVEEPVSEPEGTVISGATQEACPDYGILDVITESGEPLELSGIYEEGSYIFLPITTDTPMMSYDDYTTWAPGVYLYMVANTVGDILHILRVSVFDILHVMGEYLRGSAMYFEDPDTGISLTLPSDALDSQCPLAIGRGRPQTDVVDDLPQDGSLIEFAIGPFGLLLSEPALVRVPVKGQVESVEFYDEDAKQWVSVQEYNAADGIVEFSTDMLGRFRIFQQLPEPAAQSEQGDDPDVAIPVGSGSSGSSGGSGGFGMSGGSCFITSCRF